MEKYYSSDPIIQSSIDKYRQYEGDQNKKYQQAKFGYQAGKWGFQGLKNSQYSDTGLEFAKFFKDNPNVAIPDKMKLIMDREGTAGNMDKLVSDYETGGGGFLDIIRQAMNPDANVTAARRFGKAGMEHFTEAEIAQMSGVAPAIAEGSATGAGAVITETGLKAAGTAAPGAITSSGAAGTEAMVANEALAGTAAATEGGLLSTMEAGAMANPLALALMLLLGAGYGIGKEGSGLQKMFNPGGGIKIPK